MVVTLKSSRRSVVSPLLPWFLGFNQLQGPGGARASQDKIIRVAQRAALCPAIREDKNVFNTVAIKISSCAFPEGLTESPIRQRKDLVAHLYKVLRGHGLRYCQPTSMLFFFLLVVRVGTENFRGQEVEVGKAYSRIHNKALKRHFCIL